MADKDVVLAILQAAIAIAGLVLVYSGFIINKAGSYSDVRKGKKLSRLARGGMIPVLAALFCSFLCLRALLPGRWGSSWASHWIIFVFEIVLALTAGYAIIAAFI